MLVVGQASTLDKVRTLLDKHQPNGNHYYIEGDATSLPQGHLSGGINLAAYDMVVYDTESYPYSTILSLLNHTPGNTLRLGTYSPHTQALITEGEIYTNQK